MKITLWKWGFGNETQEARLVEFLKRIITTYAKFTLRVSAGFFGYTIKLESIQLQWGRKPKEGEMINFEFQIERMAKDILILCPKTSRIGIEAKITLGIDQ